MFAVSGATALGPQGQTNSRDVVWRCWLWSAMRANTSSAATQPESVCVCVRVHVRGCLRCWSAHAPFRLWACCTLCQDYSAVREEQRELNNLSWLLSLHRNMWLCYLDAVSELLQSFGSYRFHGGDECWQLVLGTCCCALKTKRSFTADYIYIILVPPLFTTIQTRTWRDRDLQRGVKLWLVHLQVSQDGEDGEDSWVVVSHDGPACCRHDVVPI